jgi:hypothetical protein
VNSHFVYAEVDETNNTQIIDFVFDSHIFGRVKGELILSKGENVGPCVDMMFYNGWV